MIDSHCHLYFKDFNNRHREIIDTAVSAGVHTIVNIGIDIKTSAACIALAEEHAELWATAGIHPHDAAKVKPDYIDELRRMGGHDRVVAIGEIGLDYYRDMSPRPVQRKVFEQQLQLAAELKMPIVIHTRESFDDTLAMVRDYASSLAGGVFHCFPGTADDAYRVIDLGFVVSVGGVITFKKARMADMAAEIPLDKILLETDAPYLAPVPFRGKTNYPANIATICAHLATIRGIDRDEVEKVTDRTCQKLFGLVEMFGD